MRVHDLKTWPVFFQAVWDGKKTFEVRKNDRGFVVGDDLNLREWDPATCQYTGRSVRATVPYILRDGGFGVVDGHCVLALTVTGHEANPRPEVTEPPPPAS